MAADCPPPCSDEDHTYTLPIVSSTVEQIKIVGSIVFASTEGGFEAIDAMTPYSVEVTGHTFLAIVKSVDFDAKFDFELEDNGQVVTLAEDQDLVSLGENVPTPGTSFASTY